MIRQALIISGIGIGVVLAGMLVLMLTGQVALSDLSVHGWLAFSIGVTGCILLSVGLFSLSFFSARSGHDEISDPSSD
ncbi:MAG: hypothetical protein CMK06_09420 [Ponticaulis sp.]|nr:hypothetical protein [Ponticaulis sp.]|tara:strand:- start:1725 stop:1958 length:234 start_codon:yes stop_codon:yes gene_type:complete